jgi:hypothetical protein
MILFCKFPEQLCGVSGKDCPERPARIFRSRVQLGPTSDSGSNSDNGPPRVPLQLESNSAAIPKVAVENSSRGSRFFLLSVQFAFRDSDRRRTTYTRPANRLQRIDTHQREYSSRLDSEDGRSGGRHVHKGRNQGVSPMVASNLGHLAGTCFYSSDRLT